MTKDELRQEAERRYPVGTTFDNANINKWGICRFKVKKSKFHTSTKRVVILGSNVEMGQSSHYTLYDYGKWAEIISSPVEEFVLPKDWYIVITKDNRKSVKDWWEKGGCSRHEFSISAHYGISKGSRYARSKDVSWKYNTNETTVEISFEQFKTYVLKGEDIIVPELEEKVISIIITKEYLTQKRIAFHCETEEEVRELLTIATLYGITYIEPPGNYWRVYRENTCLVFKSGKFGYSPISWHKRKNKAIIKASSILNLNKEDYVSKENNTRLRTHANQKRQDDSETVIGTETRGIGCNSTREEFRRFKARTSPSHRRQTKGIERAQGRRKR